MAKTTLSIRQRVLIAFGAMVALAFASSGLAIAMLSTLKSALRSAMGVWEVAPSRLGPEAWKALASDVSSVMVVVALIGVASVLLFWALLWWVESAVSKRVELALVSAKRMADQDFSESNEIVGEDDISAISKEMSRMRLVLGSMVSEVRSSAESISAASSQIAAGNQDLSVRTEKTASNLQQAASNLEHLTNTVGQTAESTRTANDLASAASEAAQRGGEMVAQVVNTMNDIHGASRRISEIISTIDGIAFQTNILALNAAVEAARAGEHGRGFAVVAGEVRTLAQRSAEAAREIKSLIGASVDKVDAGTRLVSETGAAMDEIVSGVRRVTEVIGEINSAATEQSGGLRQVNQAVSELDQMTQQNAALVEESAAAAESMAEQSRRLMLTLSKFKVGGVSDAVPSKADSPRVLASTAVSRAKVSRALPAAVKRDGESTTPAVAENDWTDF